MFSYTNHGSTRLYVEKRFIEPGRTFTTEQPLPNEALLIESRTIVTEDERTVLVVLDAAGLTSAQIRALATAPTPRPTSEPGKKAAGRKVSS